MFNNQDIKDLANLLIDLNPFFNSPVKLAESLFKAEYRRVPKDSVILSHSEIKKISDEMYEQGKFDAIMVATYGTTTTKIQNVIRDILKKIDSYLAKGEDYCGSLRAGLLAAKTIIALYCKEHNLEVE